MFNDNFREDYDQQDVIVLNIQRACQACIDMAAHVVKARRLGHPQFVRELFVMLAEEGVIPPNLSRQVQNMVGFRNVAVHDYTKINLDIVEAIVRERLADFTRFSAVLIG